MARFAAERRERPTVRSAWERDEPSTAPSTVIDSLDVRRALRLVEADRPALIEYLVASVRRLAGAGVDFCHDDSQHASYRVR